MKVFAGFIIALLSAASVSSISPASSSTHSAFKVDSDKKDVKKKSGPIGTSSLDGKDNRATSVSSFSSSAKTARIAEGLAKKETEKSLLKTLTQRESFKSDRDNMGHNKSTKIRVVSSKAASKKAHKESEDEEVEESSGSVDSFGIIKKQLLIGLTSLVASRYIVKLDFTNTKILKICRVIFACYLIGSQILFYIIQKKIEQCNDEREVDAGPDMLKGLQNKLPMLSTLGKKSNVIYH